MRTGISIWAVLGLALTAACARTKPAEPSTPKQQQAPAVDQVDQIVTSFVVQKCPDAPKMNSRKAEAALRQMLSPCDKVPGGSVHFEATLMPGGRIQLSTAAGERDDGVVPMCALKHALTHPVSLERPCTFDVRLEAGRPTRPVVDAGPAPSQG